MGIRLENLKEWKNILYTKTAYEDPSVKAGRDAEEFLTSMVETNLKYKGVYCYLGKRVRSHKEKRRYEIDLIVLTQKHIYMLEVKNWSGSLIRRGKQWVQIRKNGSEIINPSLTKHNRKKQELVIEYLKSKNINLDKKYFSQKVIFMNKNLRLDKGIASDSDVIPYQKLNSYLANQKGATYTERFLHSVVEFCLDAEKSSIIINELFDAMDKSTFEKTQKALAKLQTWDKVVLHGGRILTGDALVLKLESKVIQMKSLKSNTEYRLKWNRSKTFGLLQALLTKISLGKIKLKDGWHKIKTTDTLKFHLAGDPTPVQIELRDVDLIVRG